MAGIARARKMLEVLREQVGEGVWNSVDIEIDEYNETTTTTTIYIPDPPTPKYFSILTNNILKNPIFQDIISTNKNLWISGYVGDGAATVSCTESSKQFFQAIGRLEGLESLDLTNLVLPLSLLTNLFRQEEEEVPPLPELTKIHLNCIGFIDLEGWDDKEINNFISSLKKLPSLEFITTDNYIHRVDQRQRERMKKLVFELVKFPFKNGGMVNIDVHYYCQAHDGPGSTATRTTPEKIYTEGKGKMTNSNGSGNGGTWVFTDLIEVAIEAVQGNNRLQHLEFLNVGGKYNGSTEFLTEKAPTFAEALSDPSCNILDTLVIGVKNDNNNNDGNGLDAQMDAIINAVNGNINNNDDGNDGPPPPPPPPPCLPVLLEIANKLPKLSVCKFNVYGLPSSLFHQSIKDELSVERLSENQYMEEMNFFLSTTHNPAQQLGQPPFQFSDMHQVYLSLNRFHRSHFGESRKDFDPLNESPQDWVDLFTALTELAKQQKDINLLYHYFYLYFSYKSPKDSKLLSPPKKKAKHHHDTNEDSPSNPHQGDPIRLLQSNMLKFLTVAQNIPQDQQAEAFMAVAQDMSQAQQAEASQILMAALNGLQNNNSNSNALVSSACNSGGVLLPASNGSNNNGSGPGSGKNASV